MDDISNGVIATVIDLGLSRMDAGDGGDGEHVHWTPFDEEVFQGEGNSTNQIKSYELVKDAFPPGDYQFDIYRMMKELTGGIWEKFHPITNILVSHLPFIGLVVIYRN